MRRMAKLSVVVRRDEDLKPVSLEVTRGRKKLKLKYFYSPKGDVYSFEIEGRREILPSFTDIVKIVDSKRLDRIGTIELVDELTLLKKLEELTLLKKLEELTLVKKIELVEHATIDEITTIRDLTVPESSIIKNLGFEQDFVGWQKVVTPANISIDDGDYAYGLKCCKFSGIGLIQQMFPIPIDVDWFVELILWNKADALGTTDLRITYIWSDGTTPTTENIATTTSWARRVLTPTAGKKIMGFSIGNFNASRTVKIDNITMVF